MLRRFVLLPAALLLACASHVRAQEKTAPRPTFGVLAGVNVANLSGSSVEGASNRTGFIGGVFATFHFGEGIGLEPEMLYSMQGAKTGSGNAALKLNYVQLPVLLRYDVSARAAAHPFFVAGPSFGIEVSCSAAGEGVSVSCDQAGLHTTSFDLGGTLGAGVAFRAAKRSVSLGARYTVGTNDVFQNSVHAKSRFWSILAGIGI